MTATITVEGLVKSYGGLRAVDDVGFSVAEGEIFALLGPNGAGKTTTVEILEGYRSRDAGAVSVLGFDPANGGRGFRERIGIVLQSAGFEEEFTVRELLHLQAGFYPRRHDPDEVIDLVDLVAKRDAKVKTLSGGQQRRLDLALGLIGAPEVLFLDEPTTGFDPSARHRAWKLVRRLCDLGATVLLTTHYMDEAEHLADRVAVLRAGRIVAVGTPDELRDVAATKTLLTFQLPAHLCIADLPDLAGDVGADTDAISVRTSDSTRDAHVLTGWALERGIELPSLSLTRPTLEDVYLTLTEEGSDVR